MGNLRQIDQLDAQSAIRTVRLVRTLRNDLLDFIRQRGLDPTTLPEVEAQLANLEARYRRDFRALVEDDLDEAYLLGTEAVDAPMAAVGISGILAAPSRRTLEILRDFTLDLVNDVSADTRARLRRPIVLGATGVLDISSVQKEIQDILPLKKRMVRGELRLVGQTARAEAIVRTEINRVHAAGQQVRQEELQRGTGLTLRKRWITILDGRARGHHSANHGQTVNVNQNFRLASPTDRAGRSESAKFPRDPRLSAWNSTRCRCRSETLPPEGQNWDQVVVGLGRAI